MIILHITTNLATGGAELMLKRLVRHQCRDGCHRHQVISLRGLGPVSPRVQAAGIAVEAMGTNGPAGLVLGFVRLVRRIRQIPPDIVHTWMYHADLIGGSRPGWRGIAESCGAFGSRRSYLRWACRARCSGPGGRARLSRALPRRILYVAESARKVHEAIGYDPARAVVIPKG